MFLNNFAGFDGFFKVAPYKKVREVVFVNSIPRSASGKVLRRKLRDSLSYSKL